MQPTARQERLFAVGWVAAWALLSSVWCVTTARQIGATFDEPTYVAEGLQRWRTGSTAGLMKLGTMPLPVDVQTLPIYLWETWRGKPFDAVADLHTVLPVARTAALLFWWLLLAHAWLAGSALGGRWAGALAVALLACEPALAAHAALATTDIAVSACLLALLYHFRASRDGGWARRVAWPALWFGLAVLAKASGLVFGALCLFVIEGERCGWWRRRLQIGDGRLPICPSNLPSPICNLKSSLRDLFQIGSLGLLLVFVYCGCDWQPQASFLKWAHGLPDRPGSAVMVWLAEHLRLFSNAGVGIIRQVTHNIRGHGSYLLGQTDNRALWYYFPVVLSIKLSVPLLLAPAALALLNRRRRPGANWYGNWALLCALTLLLFSLTCRVQVGVRFMFPLVALAAVGLSAVLVRTVRDCGSRPGKVALVGTTMAGLLWTAAAALAVWPDGLCYVNPLWGGTENGYRLVSEGNYDWGQGLKDLARWQRRHPQTKLCVWYFGTDSAIATMPVQPLPLHAFPIRTAADVLPLVAGKHLAVSLTLIYGNVPGETIRSIHAVLKARPPVARAGTFLIYDFTDACNLSAARAPAP